MIVARRRPAGNAPPILLTARKMEWLGHERDYAPDTALASFGSCRVQIAAVEAKERGERMALKTRHAIWPQGRVACREVPMKKLPQVAIINDDPRLLTLFRCYWKMPGMPPLKPDQILVWTR